MDTEKNSNFKITKELIILNLDANNAEEALLKIGNNLQSNGFVKESYVNAVIEREKTNPTGLQSSSIGVSLPHTDAEHVKEESLSVAVLNEPIEFVHMGSEDKKVKVSIVFMLAIKDPENQLKLLQKLMSFFQKEELLEKINNSQSKDEIIKIIQNELF